MARLAGPATADELAGDVFVNAFAHRERYDPGRGSVRAWLYGIDGLPATLSVLTNGFGTYRVDWFDRNTYRVDWFDRNTYLSVVSPRLVTSSGPSGISVADLEHIASGITLPPA